MLLVVTKKELDASVFGIANHWALHVGDCWYEVAGRACRVITSTADSPSDVEIYHKAIQLKIHMNPQISLDGSSHFRGEDEAVKSEIGAETQQRIGYTNRTKQEIQQFNYDWLKMHPTYHILHHNCQVYVRDLAGFLGVEIPEAYDQHRHLDNAVSSGKFFLGIGGNFQG